MLQVCCYNYKDTNNTFYTTFFSQVLSIGMGIAIAIVKLNAYKIPTT